MVKETRYFEGQYTCSFCHDTHIVENTMLCTDSTHGYTTLSEELHLNHIKIESVKRKKHIYHSHYINLLHIQLKAFMSAFKDVAAKRQQLSLWV